ncbi:MAG: Riboflavin synthase [Fimbriimonadaceae bacterium]|nr:Riboflavin synthase [Fimbriimonadaceae bacterium]
MFTGLVQAVGEVAEQSTFEFTLAWPPGWEGVIARGESIAVDGCCLTAMPNERGIAFDLSEETVKRTTLGTVSKGTLVNLERALLAGDRLGGHFVLGHIDATAELVATREHPHARQLTFRVDPELDRLLIDKGSVALAGISLTVVTPSNGQFDVWIIPETWERTNLSRRTVGDRVNVEFDVLAKHVERLMEARLSHA